MFICDIYARLSHEENKNESIENQIKITKEFIDDSEDIILNEIKCDRGYSGIDFERPAFKEMMEDIKAGNINCVIVKDLSRLGRDYITTGRYIENIFPMYNVRFIAVNDGIDTAKENYRKNDIMIPFKNLINEFYVRDISIKTKSSLRAKMKNGEVIAAFAPYGYIKKGSGYEIDEESAETVKWIFEMYLRGYSCENIARKLNLAGIKSPNEYKREKSERYKCGFDTGECMWHYNTVRRILKNDVYCGRLIQGKRKRISYKVRKNRNVEKERQIGFEGKHKKIIEEDKFKAIQKVLENDNRCGIGNNRVYILSGLLYCGDCGEKMIRKTVGKYRYYVCGKYRKGEKCGGGRIRESEIISAVERIMEVLGEDCKGEEYGKIERVIKEGRERLLCIEDEEVREYVEEVFCGENTKEEKMRKNLVMMINRLEVYCK